MRQLVVWCPDWPAVTACAGDDPAHLPLAVLAKGRVVACTPAARADGVRRGMRRRDAQSRCPELVLRDHVPEVDTHAFEDVLLALEELGSSVAPLRPGLVAMAVPSRYYGGESEAAAVVTEHLVGRGVWDVRCGVADTVFAAEQAARLARPQDCVVVADGQAAAFLADLPVEILDSADVDLAVLLRRLGLPRVGDFAALPASDVHTRFGAHGELLHRLARGMEPRPLAGRRIPPDLTCEVSFEPPLDRVDTICFSARATAEKFVAGLADAGLVATTVRIEVTATGVDGPLVVEREWRHPRWFGPVDLVDRVRWQLQANPPGAPVDRVRLVPHVAEPWGDHADGLFGGGTDDGVERQVARVQSMLGPEGVLAAEVQGGRGPADRQLTAPWGQRAPSRRPVDQPWPGAVPPPAPATVFAAARPAEVVGAGGVPVRVTGRGAVTAEPAQFRATADEPWRPVAAWAGPWPVDDAWWDEHAARRVARFQVVGVDGSAWLMLVENGTWWAEAHYD